MKQPTQEQIKEFWEWCGFVKVLGKELWRYDKYKETNCWWQTPNSRRYKDLPEPDLNNLFKLAVPVVIDKIMAKQECSSDVAYAILFKKWLQELEIDIPHHERSLFKVIWEVIHDKD